MSGEIRIYVEGGGDGKETKARLRSAFGKFLKDLRDRARARRVGWEIIACGGRGATFNNYQRALRSHPRALNFLLVDSETAVSADSPWQHLKSHSGDNWDNPGVNDEHCHLMVQAMEAWLIADPEKLREYYKRDFHEKALPKTANVEEISKEKLNQSLRDFSRMTKKGRYHKTEHGPDILAIVRPSEVQRKARHCKRLFDTLADEIDSM